MMVRSVALRVASSSLFSLTTARSLLDGFVCSRALAPRSYITPSPTHTPNTWDKAAVARGKKEVVTVWPSDSLACPFLFILAEDCGFEKAPFTSAWCGLIPLHVSRPVPPVCIRSLPQRSYLLPEVPDLSLLFFSFLSFSFHHS